MRRTHAQTSQKEAGGEYRQLTVGKRRKRGFREKKRRRKVSKEDRKKE